MNTALLILFAVIGVTVIVAPRLGACFVWPVLLLYPQRLLLDALPYNAGYDDLLIIVLGIRTLFSRGEIKDIVTSSVVKLAAIIWLVETIGAATGVLRYPELLDESTKACLKGALVVVYAAAHVRVVRSTDDVERLTTSFLIACILAFVVVILCFQYPALAQYWEVTRWTEAERLRVGFAYRAIGPFSGSSSAGLMAVIAIVLGISICAVKRRQGVRTVLAMAGIILGTLVVLLCKSRSAILGIGGTFVVMSLTTHRRARTIAAMLVIAIIGTVIAYKASDVISAVDRRLSNETFSGDLETRISGWRAVVENPSGAMLLCGEGVSALSKRIDAAPHNGYLDVVFGLGLCGLAVFIVLYHRVFKWSRFVARRDSHWLSRAVAWSLVYSSVLVGIYALSADPWYITNYRFSLYFFLSIVWFRYVHIGGQRPQSVMRPRRQAAVTSQPIRGPRRAAGKL